MNKKQPSSKSEVTVKIEDGIEMSIDGPSKFIEIFSKNQFDSAKLYSCLKNAWITGDLIKYPFPMIMLNKKDYSIEGGWKIKNKHKMIGIQHPSKEDVKKRINFRGITEGWFNDVFEKVCKVYFLSCEIEGVNITESRAGLDIVFNLVFLEGKKENRVRVDNEGNVTFYLDVNREQLISITEEVRGLIQRKIFTHGK